MVTATVSVTKMKSLSPPPLSLSPSKHISICGHAISALSTYFLLFSLARLGMWLIFISLHFLFSSQPYSFFLSSIFSFSLIAVFPHTFLMHILIFYAPQLGHHPKAGQWQTRMVELRYCPIRLLVSSLVLWAQSTTALRITSDIKAGPLCQLAWRTVSK